MTGRYPWGHGYNSESGSYGFPESSNPNSFHPDYEVCTDKEIENHKQAIKDWEEQTNEQSDK